MNIHSPLLSGIVDFPSWYLIQSEIYLVSGVLASLE